MSYKRSVLNLQIPSWWEREFIWVDLVRGSQGYPGGYPSQTDAQGYARTRDALPKAGGGVAALPRNCHYSGYYVLTGRGEGQIRINPVNTQSWVDVRGETVAQDGVTYRGGHHYSPVGRSPPGGTYNVSDSGSGWRIVLQRTDRTSYEDLQWAAYESRPGNHVRDIHIYRIDDESDFLAGNWYNRRFKQTLIDLNPSALRFMNWTTGAGLLWRWRDRTPPTYFSNWGGTINMNLLRYDSAQCPVDKTAYVVNAVPGTPADYRHGEIVYCGVPNDWVTAAGTTAAGDNIRAMQPDDLNPAHTRVTTASGFTYHVGDVVQFFGVMGMHRMDLMSGTIRSVGVGGANNFTVDIDSRTFGKFTSGQFWVHVTLDVGGRGPAPVKFPPGLVGVTRWGRGYMHAGAGSRRVFVYDKNLAALRGADGKLTFGAWVCSTAAGEIDKPYYTPVGIEYCTKLINELEDMISAQGLQDVKGPINPWININCYGMLSTDPDYDQADHVGVGMVDVMLNGNPSLGIKGIPSRCDLFVEYSNETWNLPGGAWQYSCGMSAWRWGNSVVGYNNDAGSTALRAVQLAVDLKTAFQDNPRIKMIMGGWEVYGMSGPPNHDRAFGTHVLFGDSPATATIPPGAKPVYYSKAHGNKPPISFFWGFATAPYLDPSSDWDAARLVPSINAWIANGQKTIASVARGYPAVVTTTTPHGFKNGDMAVFTNLTWSGNGSGWNNSNGSLFGEISNVTERTFSIAIDSSAMASVTGGKVTRINGSDQEEVYLSYLQWMLNRGDGGQDIKSIDARCQSYCAALRPYGVYHVNYEGWEEMQAFVPQSGYTDKLAFIASCKQSQAMASMMTEFLNNKKRIYGSYMPSVYTQSDPGRWGFTFPNSYGFAVNGVEWSGLSKSWKAMCDYNASASVTTIKFIFSR